MRQILKTTSSFLFSEEDNDLLESKRNGPENYHFPGQTKYHFFMKQVQFTNFNCAIPAGYDKSIVAVV